MTETEFKRYMQKVAEDMHRAKDSHFYTWRGQNRIQLEYLFNTRIKIKIFKKQKRILFMEGESLHDINMEYVGEIYQFLQSMEQAAILEKAAREERESYNSDKAAALFDLLGEAPK